jgi:surface antigen
VWSNIHVLGETIVMTVRMRWSFVAALFGGLALAACASDHHDSTPVVFGAAFGGFLGTQTDRGASAPFATVGAIGRHLNDEDRRRMQDAEDRAYRGPVGETVTWNNQASGHSGRITSKSAHKGASGDMCREFEAEVSLGSRTETGYGIACQQADGSWKTVS